jgi:hypothetical protein
MYVCILQMSAAASQSVKRPTTSKREPAAAEVFDGDDLRDTDLDGSGKHKPLKPLSRKISAKIFSEARSQQLEVDAEAKQAAAAAGAGASARRRRAASAQDSDLDDDGVDKEEEEEIVEFVREDGGRLREYASLRMSLIC